MQTLRFTRFLFGKFTAISAAIALLPAVGGASIIISLNVRDGNTSSNANVIGTFGIAAENSVVGNWTNTNTFAVPTGSLINSLGSPSGVTATISNPGGQQYWGAGYAGTPWNYGPAQFQATANSTTVTFNNLSAAFPDGFFALVYVNGNTANSGAAITDGTTTYYFQSASSASTTPVLITDTNSADGYQVGNYAKFGSELSPLSGNTISFSIPAGSVVDSNVGIGGVQLIAVPEPGTYALVLGVLAVAAVAIRRRRK